jgi:hypothetical protein
MPDGREMLDKLKSLKDRDKNYDVQKTKATYNAAFIGLGAGLIIGFSRGYNIFTSAFVGAAIAALAAHLFIPNEENEEDYE